MKLTLFATITLLAIHTNCVGSENKEIITFHEIMPSGTRMTMFSDGSMFATFASGSQVARLSDKTQILIPESTDTHVYIEDPQQAMEVYSINNLPAHLGNPATCFLGSHKFNLLSKKIKADEKVQERP